MHLAPGTIDIRRKLHLAR